MGKKIDSNFILGGVGETLLLPLYARARDFKEKDSILKDRKAWEILNQIEYDFSEMNRNYRRIQSLSLCVRAQNLDRIISKFIKKHPKATIVCLGSGLETNYYRVDNGKIIWYDLDYPGVIELRKQLLPEPKRVRYISKSLFEKSWIEEINQTKNGLLFIACGVFIYFEKEQLKELFFTIATSFPGSEMAFDWHSKSAIIVGNNNVLKKNGLDSKLMVWSTRNPRSIIRWNKSFEMVEYHTRYKYIKRNLNWGKEIIEIMDIIDQGRVSGVAHIRFKKKE